MIKPTATESQPSITMLQLHVRILPFGELRLSLLFCTRTWASLSFLSHQLRGLAWFRARVRISSSFLSLARYSRFWAPARFFQSFFSWRLLARFRAPVCFLMSCFLSAFSTVFGHRRVCYVPLDPHDILFKCEGRRDVGRFPSVFVFDAAVTPTDGNQLGVVLFLLSSRWIEVSDVYPSYSRFALEDKAI